jgi:hypothetical protein
LAYTNTGKTSGTHHLSLDGLVEWDKVAQVVCGAALTDKYVNAV